jgi:hypothetical protein
MKSREEKKMQIAETAQIVQRVTVIDGRVASDQMVKAWHDLIGHLQFEVANRAATLALQDYQIPQVAPKHVLGKMPSAVAELNVMLRNNVSDESTWRSDPEPICREHLTRITRCDSCCDVLMHQVGHLRGGELHRWAVAHLYVEDTAGKKV